MQAPGTRPGGWRVGETVVKHPSLGIGKPPCLAEILEHKTRGPVPKMGRGGGEDKGRDMVFASRSHVPCGTGTPSPSPPPRVNLKEGKQEAEAGSWMKV